MKPTLLYLTPVVPSFTGNGLAMRAGMVLDALARVYRVSVLTAQLYPSLAPQLPAGLRQLCENAVQIPADQIGQSAAYEEQSFDVVHVFRLALLAVADPYLKRAGTGARHLDLDDIESKTCRRIAAIYRDNGDERMARQAEAAARKTELLEVVAFRRFDRIYVCSEGDRAELRQRCPAEIRILPNVPPAGAPAVARTPDEVWRLLFVGTLGYYPNEDAVIYFCTRVLPRIREVAGCPVEVSVAGSGGSARLREVTRHAGVRLQGLVPDLAPAYQAADAVLVPIRAGGGTRIKILEAFAHGRPVISTTVGAEGIDARAGEHLLIADTPQDFADSCVRVLTDRLLWERLVANSLALLRRRYTRDALLSAVAVSPKNY